MVLVDWTFCTIWREKREGKGRVKRVAC